MTTALATTAAGARPRARGARLVEFLMVGGLTPLLFPLSWALREAFGLSEAEYWTGFTFFYAAHLINDPHFSVTYLLFYEDGRARAFGGRFSRWQRARYLAAGIGVPLLVGGWAIGCLWTQSAFGLGLMIQLMFLLVGWHYVKQGFGVMVVLSARRGVRYSKRERLALLAHCYAGWAYAWASPFDPGHEAVEKGVFYSTFAHPGWLEPLTLTVFAASTVWLVAELAAKTLRDGRLPPLAPLTGLLCAVWAWSVFSQVDPLVRYAVPALHGLQYLYFVWLLKGNEAREREGPPHFETSARTRLVILVASALALGLFLFDLAPMGLDDYFAPGAGQTRDLALGATPYFAALYCFVNIHHYAMDAVIWRRDNPQTRYLRG